MSPSPRIQRERMITAISLGAFFCLFLYGFIDNLKGVTLPHMLNDLQLSYSQGGAIQQGAYFGFLAATLLSGLLILRHSHLDILLIGAACLFLGVIGYSMFSHFFPLLISMITIGLGLGFLDLVGIRLIVDFYDRKKGQLLNLSAFFHGLASMLAPLYSGLVLSRGFVWNNVYQIALVFVFLFTVNVLRMRSSIAKIPAHTEKNEGAQFIQALKNTQAWVYYILILSYEAIEIGFAVWISEFLETSRDQHASVGITILSTYFLLIMLGRLLGSFIVERVGYLRMLFIASIGVSLCLTLGIFGQDAALFCLPLTGFFLSIIFPTATASASEEIRGMEDFGFSLFFTFAGLGGMIGSWAVGFIADRAGMRMGFALLILMAILMIAMVVSRIVARKSSIRWVERY